MAAYEPVISKHNELPSRNIPRGGHEPLVYLEIWHNPVLGGYLPRAGVGALVLNVEKSRDCTHLANLRALVDLADDTTGRIPAILSFLYFPYGDL